MSERSEHDPSLSRLESALAGLKPAPASLDRDRLMFRAGQASAGRGWVWPTSTAALFATSLVLTAALALRPGPTETVRVVYAHDETVKPTPPPPVAPAVAAPTAEPLPSAPASAPYLALRAQVLRFGVESLPDPPPLTAGTPGPTLDRLFDSPHKPGSEL